MHQQRQLVQGLKEADSLRPKERQVVQVLKEGEEAVAMMMMELQMHLERGLGPASYRRHQLQYRASRPIKWR
jgi:hypothetical protein